MSEQLEDRTLLSGISIALGQSVFETIGTVGDSDQFSFTLGTETRVCFDALSTFGNVVWSLEGPAGVEIANQSMQNHYMPNGSAIMKLMAGDYDLTFKSVNDTTGGYSFRLLDLGIATALASGTPVSNVLNPATEMDVYSLAVNAGDRFTFDTSTVDPMNAGWRLVDPVGRDVFNTSLGVDQINVSLSMTGSYRLFVEGNVFDAGTVGYDFTVSILGNTPPAVLTGTVLVPGTTLKSGSIAVPGEIDNFKITLASASRLYFDAISTAGGITWTLEGPAGIEVQDRSFESDTIPYGGSPVLNLMAGVYQLRIAGAGGATGAYSFRLLNLGAATALTPGILKTSTLNPANETDTYSFSATAGDKFYFDTQTANPQNAYWTLLDPLGRVVFTTGLGTDIDTQTLSLTGTYTVLIEGYFHETPGTMSYSFNVKPVVDAAPVPLTLGSTVSGNIAVSGERDLYSFTLGSASRLYFDTLSTLGNQTWTLKGPAGVEVSSRVLENDAIPWAGNTVLNNLMAGDYELTIDGNGETTGAYSFRMLNLGAAPALTLGTLVTSTLNPANETDAYSFPVTAGDKFFFDSQTATPQNAYLTLLDPLGRTVTTALLAGDIDTQTLSLTGTYTVLIEGYFYDAGTVDYSFKVQPVTDAAPVPLTLGSTVSGDIAVSGERDRYTFNLGSASRLYFDTLSMVGNQTWTLKGPAGVEVSSRALENDTIAFYGSQALNLMAGDYELTVDGNGEAVGGYSFRMLNLGAAPALTLGTLVTSTLNPANETDAYSFTATAGDKLYFDMQNSTPQNSYWTLLDPLGRPVTTVHLGSDIDTQTLSLTGTYNLLIEGYYYDTGIVDYSFKVHQVDVEPAQSSLSSSSIAENKPHNTVVGLFNTSDVDETSVQSYSLVSGPGDADNASFTIDGGQLKSTTSFDFESKSSYSIRVQTIDNIGLKFETVMVISVLDQPEGTAGDDAFVLTYSANTVAVTNGATDLGTFLLDVPLTLYGLGGTDSVNIVGTSGNDVIKCWNSGFISVNDAQLFLDSTESLLLAGGAGDDTYGFNGGAITGLVTLDEGLGGTDLIDFEDTSVQAMSINLSVATVQVVCPKLSLILSSATTFENVYGGGGNDTITGNTVANLLNGGSGNDSLVGGSGNDTLIGSLGNDSQNGGAGDDLYQFYADLVMGSDTLTDTTGTETISFGKAGIFFGTTANVTFDLGLTTVQSINGGFLSLKLASATTFDNLIGGEGSDTLTGNAGANTLIGGAGNDALNGAAGDDTYLLDADTDAGSDTLTDTTGIETISFAGTAANVTFSLGSTAAQSINGGLLTVTLASATTFDNLIGGDGNDTLSGGSGNNTMSGGAGNDVLDGGAGNDTYLFDADNTLGSDTVTDAVGTDTIGFSGTTAGVTVDLGSTAAQSVNGGLLTLNLSSATTFDNLTGGDGNDTLTGNGNINILTGGAGNDTLAGGLGNDIYVFDADTALGTDTIVEAAAAGTDTLSFSLTTTKAVVLNLGTDSSQVVNSNLSLILQSGAAIENITGGSQSDTLTGNALVNSLNGGLGNDVLVGSAGNDTMTGGADNDTYRLDTDAAGGTDTINETGGGIDTLDFTLTTTQAITADISLATVQAVNVNLSLILGSGPTIENVKGGSLNDVLTGNSLANTLTGNGGNDTLEGGAGDDIQDGSAGNDTYKFDADSALGSDTLTDAVGAETISFAGTTADVIFDLGSTAAQSINGGMLTLTLSSATDFDHAVGGDGNDTLTAGAGTSTLTGGAGNDTLIGGAGVNTLIGGPGDDLLNGGAGNDTYLFDADSALGSDTLTDAVGTETVSFAGTTASVTFNMGLTTAQVINGGLLTLTLSSATDVDSVIGGDGNDTLTGNAGANTMTGGAGNDALAGGAGNDTYAFDADISLGSDILTDPSGTETITFAATAANVTFSLATTAVQSINGGLLLLKLATTSSFDNLTGGTGNDTLSGNAVVNSLAGGTGDDTLNGDAGNDSLTGGAGNDTTIGGAGNDIYVLDTDASIGTDTIDESGGGIDTLDFILTTTKVISIDVSLPAVQVVNSNLSLILGSATTIENVKGGALDDVLTGNTLANTLTGNAGNDTLNGADGDDTLVGLAGNDSLNGGVGNDSYQLDADVALGSDTITDTAGIDVLDFVLTTAFGIVLDLEITTAQIVNANLTLTVQAGTEIETVLGTAKNDVIRGNSAANILVGNAGNDQLEGRAGRDFLIGGLGADTLTGGDDDDIMIGGRTTMDGLIVNLNNIRAEWTSGNSYGTRINNIRAGVGSPLSSLQATVNVLNDSTSGSADSLTGGSGDDWFFKALDDVITDVVGIELTDLL